MFAAKLRCRVCVYARMFRCVCQGVRSVKYLRLVVVAVIDVWAVDNLIVNKMVLMLIEEKKGS
jgi:hypothetical protein